MLKRADSPLSDAEEEIVHRVIGCALAVHRELGPGFREHIYQRALCLELSLRRLKFECEKRISVRYKQWEIPGQTVDMIVEQTMIIEAKALPALLPLHDWQVQSYLKTTGLKVGLLLNFNTERMTHGIRRIVWSPNRSQFPEQSHAQEDGSQLMEARSEDRPGGER